MAPTTLTSASARVVKMSAGWLSEDQFYAERDKRTSLVHGTVGRPVRVIIVVNHEGSATREVLLLTQWSASLLRRMGRAFSSSTIVASDEFLNSSVGGAPVRQQLTRELLGADPFGIIEFRTPNADVLADADFIVTLGGGGWVSKVPGVSLVVHEWVIGSTTCSSGLPVTPIHANGAALLLGASFVAARAYSSCVLGDIGEPVTAFSLDTGRVTDDRAEMAEWLMCGTSNDVAASITESLDAPARIARLVLVSAGGLGMNVAAGLPYCGIDVDELVVIDSDAVEISNLNRLLHVGLDSVGRPKATIAADLAGRRSSTVTVVVDSYEAWRSAAGFSDVPNQEVLLIGVDQVATRIDAAADWPRILVNGATAGLGCVSSVHRPGEGGCLGCYYGRASLSYADLHRPMACGAGGLAQSMPARAVASYPFVSSAGAALMLANLIQTQRGQIGGGSVTQMNVSRPSRCTRSVLQPVPSCRLLCCEPILKSLWDEYKV